jgi:hypothetical protein
MQRAQESERSRREAVTCALLHSRMPAVHLFCVGERATPGVDAPAPIFCYYKAVSGVVLFTCPSDPPLIIKMLPLHERDITVIRRTFKGSGSNDVQHAKGDTTPENSECMTKVQNAKNHPNNLARPNVIEHAISSFHLRASRRSLIPNRDGSHLVELSHSHQDSLIYPSLPTLP